MPALDNFKKAYSIEDLHKTYNDSVILSHATGIDNLTHKKFWPILNDQLEIISRKTIKGNYKFTKYKLKLISKGRNKSPREISIPTIRDRLALKSLCNFLFEVYQDDLSFELPQFMVRRAKEHIESGNFTGFIKLDVQNFYPSIDHTTLLKKLRKRTRSKLILNFIERAISTPTVAEPAEAGHIETRGVPQGLSISNVLAAIYLSSIDKKYQNRSDLQYFRYVDDVFIVCKFEEISTISNRIIKDFEHLQLNVHTPTPHGSKSVSGRIYDPFDYLGYHFSHNMVTAREGSIKKLKESLISIFSAYKYSKNQNVKFLQWRLNLRITGCVFKNKGKGWLFFFSEINDDSLLHNLDRHVQSLISRFNVPITPKKFVRTFFELKHHRYTNNYIPNYDTYTIPQMTQVLSEYFGRDTSKLLPEQIEYEFNKRINKQAKELLVDIQNFGGSG
ncbi:reverse transcriptase domain-containing protein [Pseudomonas sp. NPDC089530]|uniref:reverse transcriptase domain-containing protein n=1 Tax=Pseudomonas sp. NPDC089530 TaxID=3390651 RepID=UPI003D07D817